MNLETLKVIFESAKIGSAQFVHIRNYKNQQGEVSNYLINLGMSFNEQREKDLIKLLAVEYPENPVKELARTEMVASKHDNTTDEFRTVASQAQLDAYLDLCPNVKLHKASYELHLKSFLVKKEVIVPGVYKSVNSQAKTIAKRVIEKELDLATAKYRQFKFSNMDQTTISINGDQIEITY